MLGAQRRKDLHPFERKSLIHLVRLAGIEPTTPWFVAKYSIQLSYSREAEIVARELRAKDRFHAPACRQDQVPPLPPLAPLAHPMRCAVPAPDRAPGR